MGKNASLEVLFSARRSLPLTIKQLYTGCGKLWVTDGIWSLSYPHCMYKMKVYIYSVMYNHNNMLANILYFIIII